MTTTEKAIKTVGTITFIGLVSKLLGFIRELVVARHYGATASMDAFNIAFCISDILFTGLGTALTITFVPTFIDKVVTGGTAAALKLSRKLITASCLVGIIMSGVGMVFATPVIALLAPKFSPALTGLTANLTRILLISGVFTILSGICVGFLQAWRKFIIPACMGFPLSIIVIMGVMIFAKVHGIYTLAIASTIAVFFQFLLVMSGMIREGFHPYPSFDFRDPELYRVASLVMPIFIGIVLFQVNSVLSRIFASGLPEGSISALYYAGKINILIVSIFANDISTISLPALSQAAARKDWAKLSYTMSQAIRGINFVIIPLMVMMVLFRVPLIQLLFQRGAFNSTATERTALALCFLTPGLFSYGLREVITRVFYALQDTKTPIINIGITIILNILMTLILVPHFGIAGLAGAASLSANCGGIQFLFALRRKIGDIKGRVIAISFLKVLTASLLMGLILVWIYPAIGLCFPGMDLVAQGIRLGVIGGMGLVLYLLGLYCLKAEEITMISAIILKYFRKAS